MFEKYCNIGWMNLAQKLIDIGENKCIKISSCKTRHGSLSDRTAIRYKLVEWINMTQRRFLRTNL